MIRQYGRFDEYAYRTATRDLDPGVSALEEGQWVTINAAGNVIVSVGAVGTKGFLCVGSKRSGRDQVTGKPVQKVSYLNGPFELQVSNYDGGGTYTAPMTPLKVMAGGVLTNWVTGTDKVEMLVAWAIGAPSTDGYLTIVAV